MANNSVTKKLTLIVTISAFIEVETVVAKLLITQNMEQSYQTGEKHFPEMIND
jgi:hypothetical protein